MTEIKKTEAVTEKCIIGGAFAAGNYAQKYIISSACTFWN
jgi:hypothetical protein